jgi:hypothetical protein
MSSPVQPITRVTAAAPIHVSFLAKIEAFFKTVGSDIVKVETAVLGANATTQLNTALKSMVEGPLGQVAVEAVTAAADLEKGTISVSQAASAIVSSAKAAGQTVGGSVVTALIAAAQAALESKLGAVFSLVA